ncbi:MAG: DUF4915 domain-containing protein [Verrucomicrobiaceae bacterium]|nr:MAG: DUF4915 domain-containing protein [Verrucomicrobiaceae bacterium]
MTTAAPQGSFLVTSVGAYADSGIGTGGFVCVHEGKAVTIDKIDSTGLCVDGEIVYRFARGLKSIVGYDREGICYQLRTEDGLDVHDILLYDGKFLCVATGTNEVIWLDPLGNVVRRWQADGKDDAWHLNCVWKEGERLYFSAFGRFASHREWVGKCRGLGFIFDLESGKDVVTGLSGPHNPRRIDGQWVVCDSHASSLELRDPDGTPKTIQLGGFTRGLAYDDHYFYVGESANRKAEKPAETSAVAIVDRKTHEVVDRITIPFPEIYEVVMISPDFAQRIVSDLPRFQINAAAERIRLLEEQVELGVREAAVWRQRVENLRVPEAIWSRMVNVKRRLVG